MSVVVLTFTSSDEEIVSGVPRTVTIESNVPSTIYYTLDGTTPNTDSFIYTDTLEMPEGDSSVTLSAFGIDFDGYESSVLTQLFAADQTQITVSRMIGAEGFVVNRYDDLTDTEWGFDADGYAVSYIDHPIEDLDIIRSDRGYLGIYQGAQIEVSTPLPSDTAYPFDDDFEATTTPEQAEFFNPYAKSIVMDSRINNDLRIINRPFGSMRTLARDDMGFGQLSGTDSTYVSGGFLRRFYSPQNNIMVSYYFDHNEIRHVKNIQGLPSIPRTLGFNSLSQPLVFQWIERGRHSAIPI